MLCWAGAWGPLPAPWSVALMFARWRSLRLRSLTAGPEGGPEAGEGPVGVPDGGLLDLGPEGGGPVGEARLREPLLGVMFVCTGGGMSCANLAMREGCIPLTGPPSAAGVEGCDERSIDSANSWRLEGSRDDRGPGVAAGCSPLEPIVDPGAVKLRPPLLAGPFGALGPDGVSKVGAFAGAFSLP